MIDVNSVHFENALPALGNAIIERAVKDYRISRVILADATKSKCVRRNAKKMLVECAKFLQSERAQQMTKNDMSGIWYLLKTESLEKATWHVTKEEVIEIV